MPDPKCDRCGQAIPDWQANIMVDAKDLFEKKEINAIEVVCKPCTVELDAAGHRTKFHNLWELTWIRRRFMGLLASVLADLTSNPPMHKWSKAAVDRFWQLGALALPETAKPPIDLDH